MPDETAQRKKGLSFSDLLVHAGVLPQELLEGFRRQAPDDDALRRLLISRGYLTAEQLAQLTAYEHGWNFIDLRAETLPHDVVTLLPRPVADAQEAVPFRREDGVLSLALVTPSGGPFPRLLRKKFGPSVALYHASRPAVHAALALQNIRAVNTLQILLQQMRGEVLGKEDRAIVDFVDAFILTAVRRGASDIHIEPQEGSTVMRLRIDGLLHHEITFTPAVHARVVLRIKVLANLATDEHAVPQDGKIPFQSPDGEHVDARVSIIPTIHGEKVVLRLLVSEEQALPLESLGLLGKDREIMETETKRTWGMVLVTGPTGSGKTTTLYAIMRRLNQEHLNISTIEDPVEYQLPGANQIQTNEKVGLTFAAGLRSLVRQDPNIILVGEIRDPDTAGIAVNAAMTGHLVLSTLHTNDAPTAVPRLLNMGIEPFLIASTVNVIIAQRLVRTVCVRCREGVEMGAAELAAAVPPDVVEALLRGRPSVRLYRGNGCPLCQGTGYHGRMGIFEVLRLDERIRPLIMQRETADTIRTAAREGGMRTMIEDGLAKVLEGVTTVQEILRVIHS